MLKGFDSDCVLSIGPEFKNHRGGVGAVIEGYSKNMDPFHFYCTYKSTNKYGAILYSLFKLSCFPFYLLFNKQFKIVHIHGASKGSFYRKYFIFFCSKLIFRKKIIYHVHGGGFHNFYVKSNSLTKFLVSQFLNHADVTICLSKSWEKYFSTNFEPKRLVIVPNFIQKNCSLKSYKKEGKVIFLFLGKVVATKGIYDFIEVIKELLITYDNKFELWVGGNGEIQFLENLIKENKLEPYVKYLGWIKGDRKEEILKASDIYVLPSYKEGLPVSILEAMSYGMPIISTKVGGIPELVKDNVSGILIEPGDKKALKSAVEIFLTDKNQIKTMGKESYSIVNNNFTTEIALTKVNQIYEDLESSN